MKWMIVMITISTIVLTACTQSLIVENTAIANTSFQCSSGFLFNVSITNNVLNGSCNTSSSSGGGNTTTEIRNAVNNSGLYNISANTRYKSIVLRVTQNGENAMDVEEYYNDYSYLGSVNANWTKTRDGVGSYRLIPPTNIFANHTDVLMPRAGFLFNGDIVAMLFSSCYVDAVSGWIGCSCIDINEVSNDNGIDLTFEVRIY